MATEVILPRVDMDMAEGKIACWYVKNGDQVRKGQVLFDIETDKATMEVEAPASGVIDSIDGAIGVTMPVGRVGAGMRAPGAAGVEGTSAPPAARQATGTAATAAVPEPGHATAMSPPVPMVSTAAQLPFRSDGASLRATPLARSLARERGVDLLRLRGRGPRGRPVGRGVAAPSRPSPPAGPQPGSRTGRGLAQAQGQRPWGPHCGTRCTGNFRVVPWRRRYQAQAASSLVAARQGSCAAVARLRRRPCILAAIGRTIA